MQKRIHSPNFTAHLPFINFFSQAFAMHANSEKTVDPIWPGDDSEPSSFQQINS